MDVSPVIEKKEAVNPKCGNDVKLLFKVKTISAPGEVIVKLLILKGESITP